MINVFLFLKRTNGSIILINKLTKDGEPTVVYAWPAPDTFIIYKQTEQDLGDFLLELFKEMKENLE